MCCHAGPLLPPLVACFLSFIAAHLDVTLTLFYIIFNMISWSKSVNLYNIIYKTVLCCAFTSGRAVLHTVNEAEGCCILIVLALYIHRTQV